MKKLREFRRTIVIVAAGMTALSAGLVAYDDLRFWATRSEHVEALSQIDQIALRTCNTELSLLYSERRDIQRQLNEAEQKQNWSWVQTLQEQLTQVERQIRQVRQSCGLS